MTALRFLVLMVVGGLGLGLSLSLIAPPAWSAACRVTTTPLTFGNYDMSLMTARGGTAQVTITCTNKEVNPATVQLTLSTGSSMNFGQRSMTGSNGGLPLNYNIYSNAGLSTVLGDGNGGSTAPTALVYKTLTWIVTLYGSIPPQQSVLVGSYSDSLIATILY